MNEALVESIKNAAYFQWEQTQFPLALSQWYCAEDIACFLEEMGILCEDDIISVLSNDKVDLGYVEFVRHIAFRFYVYSGENQQETNWYDAEKILHNSEWRKSITAVASIFRRDCDTPNLLHSIRLEKVKAHYKNKV